MVLRINPKNSRVLWWGVFLGSLLPLVLLIYDAAANRLGADPAKEIVLELGLWAAIFLWVDLWVSPLKRRLGLGWLIRFRRLLGLYGFFYAILHLVAFATFMVGWRADLLFQELSERPYIIMGALAVLLLIPLVVTSTKGMQRRLGKSWKMLHRLVFVISILVMGHIIWMIRADYLDAIVFGILLSGALIERMSLKWGPSQTKSVL